MESESLPKLVQRRSDSVERTDMLQIFFPRSVEENT